MPDGLEISAEVLSLVSQAGLEGVGDAALGAKLARLRTQQEKGQADLEQHAGDLKSLYEYAINQPDAPLEHLVQTAEILRQKRDAAAEVLRPGIETLRKNLSLRLDVMNSNMRDYFERSLFIAERWLTLYDEARDKILELAERRKATTGRVLKARPVEGEIDYAELTRDTIAKFPKILAALAK